MPDGVTEVVSSKATTLPQRVRQLEINDDINQEDDDVVSLITASTAFDPGNILRLPSLSDLSTDDEPFECPICYTLQNPRNERAWK